MNSEINTTINTLPPFKYFCSSIGAIPSSYLETMSYDETLIWLCNYLKETVIPTVNNTGNAVTELQNLYLELENYVNTYFDNLDVQNEINNKLDNMALSGELSQIIGQYVDPIFEEKIAEIDRAFDYQNNLLKEMNTKINEATSGSPLVASSTSEMTNTSRIYVNTTDGKWYYYDGDSWEIGGTYQSTGIGENEVKTVNLDTQIINKIKNLAYAQNSEMTKDFDLNYTSTTNKYIYPLGSNDTINLTPGVYFLATKVLISELAPISHIYMRQGIRIGSTDKLVSSAYRQDADFNNTESNDDINTYKWMYGFYTIDGEDNVNARNMITLVNVTQTNPLTASLRVEETYCFKVSEVSEDNKNNCFERISSYAFQEDYPILNLVNYDKNKIYTNIDERLTQAESEMNTIESKVNDIENNVLIPSYLMPQLKNIVTEFNPSAKSLSLIFQTDLHSNNNTNIKQCASTSVKASNYLMERLPIALNILGGDYIANGENTTKNEATIYMKDILSLVTSKAICLKGNHDCNQLQQNTNELLSELETFNIIGKKYLINNPEIHTNNNIPSPMYGYIDYDFQKIRMVFVNTSDGYDQNLIIGMGNINTSQLQWLADNAFDLTGKEDYQVIVFGHYPIYDFDDESATVEQGRLNALKELLLAFKNGTNLNYTASGNNYKVIKDFTSQGAKTLIAYVCGHNHEDDSILTSTDILQISTTNAGYYNKENNVGTYNEFAFDIITINTINSSLSFKRVGYGNSRNFNY